MLFILQVSILSEQMCIIIVSMDQCHIPYVKQDCSKGLRCHICMCHRAEGVNHYENYVNPSNIKIHGQNIEKPWRDLQLHKQELN